MEAQYDTELFYGPWNDKHELNHDQTVQDTSIESEVAFDSPTCTVCLGILYTYIWKKKKFLNLNFLYA